MPRKRRNKTSPAAIERAQRQNEAVKLRLAGLDYRTIGERLGVATSTAHELVTSAIAEFKRDNVELLIDTELQRLDVMQVRLWPKVLRADEKAAALVLKIMDRRGRYYAVDEYASQKLAGDLADMSDVDAWTAHILGRDERPDLDALTDSQLAELIASELTDDESTEP